MSWQLRTFDRVVDQLGGGTAAVQLRGSATVPESLDGWSDLDLRLNLQQNVLVTDIVGGDSIWAYQDTITEAGQVCRIVLGDGRRLDLAVEGPGRIVDLHPARDNEIRFLAALAVTKLGRGDRLIGGHLTLELLRDCLVQAMLLRDRDQGTTVHRFGTVGDAAADAVREIAAAPLTATPRPNPVERAVRLYATWRRRLDGSYRPDWSGLTAVIDCGLTAG